MTDEEKIVQLGRALIAAHEELCEISHAMIAAHAKVQSRIGATQKAIRDILSANRQERLTR